MRVSKPTILCLAALLASCAPLAAQQYTISTYAGSGVVLTRTAATTGSIGAPHGIVIDSAGNVYFASATLHAVFKLDTQGVLTRVAGTERSGYSGDGGPAANARLNLYGLTSLPRTAGLALDAESNLYIADSGN